MFLLVIGTTRSGDPSPRARYWPGGTAAVTIIAYQFVVTLGAAIVTAIWGAVILAVTAGDDIYRARSSVLDPGGEGSAGRTPVPASGPAGRYLQLGTAA